VTLNLGVVCGGGLSFSGAAAPSWLIDQQSPAASSTGQDFINVSSVVRIRHHLLGDTVYMAVRDCATQAWSASEGRYSPSLAIEACVVQWSTVI
jgi:hypothetical protein